MTLADINVTLTYKTLTPFLYCELEGMYRGDKISIAVVETSPGEAETISGVKFYDNGQREGRPSECPGQYWHASLRTNRLNFTRLFYDVPQNRCGAAGQAFTLRWKPTQPGGEFACDSQSEILFGRVPEILVLNE